MGNALSQVYPPKPTFTGEDLPDLSGNVCPIPYGAGRVFIVTGGSSGVGLELVKLLYDKNGKVYVATRSEERANNAIKEVKSMYPNSTGIIAFIHLDLSDLTNVKSFVDEFVAMEERLDVLFNNAGLLVPSKEALKTKQGYELHMGVNCLGHLLLTTLLLPVLRTTTQSSPKDSVRVVWTGSQNIELLSPKYGLSMDDVKNWQRNSHLKNYTLSKTGNLFLGSQFAKRFGIDGIMSVTQNPGNLWTGMQRHFEWYKVFIQRMLVFYPARFGAYTALFAGFSPTIKETQNGAYIIPWGRVHTGLRNDITKALEDKENGGLGHAEEFWKWCHDIIRPYLG